MKHSFSLNFRINVVFLKNSAMKKIFALLGWKYVKDNTTGQYHHYKCPKLKGIHNHELFNKVGMKEDIARHPYSIKTGNCLDGVI